MKDSNFRRLRNVEDGSLAFSSTSTYNLRDVNVFELSENHPTRRFYHQLERMKYDDMLEFACGVSSSETDPRKLFEVDEEAINDYWETHQRRKLLVEKRGNLVSSL